MQQAFPSTPIDAVCSGFPRVSVIMATWNGERHIRASIDSILSQTFMDFELIVGDDGSTDGTLAILESYADPRLRILRNERNIGVVGTRNRLFEAARGDFVAMLDHDDISRPTRLHKQVEYLDANPDVVLVGTDAHLLRDGHLSATRHPSKTTPQLIDFLLHVSNPLICSSVMLRTHAVRQLGVFMREECRYADDYDLYHRLSRFGAIARLDEPLTIYRVHQSNAFKRHEDVMHAGAARALAPKLADILGGDGTEAATLMVCHLFAGKPIEDAGTLRQLSSYYDTLVRAFLTKAADDPVARTQIAERAAIIWHRTILAAARHGGVSEDTLRAHRPGGLALSRRERLCAAAEAPLRRLWKLASGSRRDGAEAAAELVPAMTPAHAPRQVFGTVFHPRPIDPEQLPTLFVTVDTEAEFDWDRPFARDMTSVAAMDAIGRGQEVFDRYGLRPIYLVDYPVATQERGARPLREILDRGGCEIGVHVHPWTTPPFIETLDIRNSFSGNLAPEIEEAKIASLVAAVRKAFGITPRFYKSGRWGFGPATATALARHGIKVDFSILPGADLSGRGGPDFRGLENVPYEIGETGILTIPMTRRCIGFAPPLAGLGDAIQGTPAGRRLHVPSILARLRISDVVTLTPEGCTAEEQIRLLQTLLKRGYRQFVLHYHSPSLATGHTYYARTRAESDEIVRRLQSVCRFFFKEVGGLPGYPRDLIRKPTRQSSNAAGQFSHSSTGPLGQGEGLDQVSPG